MRLRSHDHSSQKGLGLYKPSYPLKSSRLKGSMVSHWPRDETGQDARDVLRVNKASASLEVATIACTTALVTQQEESKGARPPWDVIKPTNASSVDAARFDLTIKLREWCVEYNGNSALVAQCIGCSITECFTYYSRAHPACLLCHQYKALVSVDSESLVS